MNELKNIPVVLLEERCFPVRLLYFFLCVE